MAAEFEFVFHRERRSGKGGACIAGLGGVLETEIVAELRMDRGSTRLQRRHHVHDGGQFFPVDQNEIDGVLRLRTRGRHHCCDRFTLVAGMIGGEHVLNCGFMTRAMRRHRMHGFADLGDFSTGDDPHHAGRLFRHGRIDAVDPGMAVRAADEGDMQHVRHGDVVGIPSLAVDQPADIGPRDRLADKAGAASVCRAHAASPVLPPARDFAVASTASMMA